MNTIKEITKEQEWHELFETSTTRPVMVFKHSTTCPVSAEAHKQFQAFVEDSSGDLTFSRVLVIESRPISNLIAEELKVKHESPQLIILKDKQVIWSDSHWKITIKNIKAALS